MAKQLLSPIPNYSTTTANGSRVSCAGRCLPIRLGSPVSVATVIPIALPPSCPIRSIFTNPGTAWSHCAYVRIGIESFSSDPDWVWLRPRSSIAPLSGARRLSIAAADMTTSVPTSPSSRAARPGPCPSPSGWTSSSASRSSWSPHGAGSKSVP